MFHETEICLQKEVTRNPPDGWSYVFRKTTKATNTNFSSIRVKLCSVQTKVRIQATCQSIWKNINKKDFVLENNLPKQKSCQKKANKLVHTTVLHLEMPPQEDKPNGCKNWKQISGKPEQRSFVSICSQISCTYSISSQCVTCSSVRYGHRYCIWFTIAPVRYGLSWIHKRVNEAHLKNQR